MYCIHYRQSTGGCQYPGVEGNDKIDCTHGIEPGVDVHCPGYTSSLELLVMDAIEVKLEFLRTWDKVQASYLSMVLKQDKLGIPR